MFEYISAVLLATILVSRVNCAPTAKDSNKNQTENTVYDYSKFDEVYDQRQNGSENYKVNVNGVVLVYAPPESLFSMLTLLDPLLLDGDDAELEEILKPSKPGKPEELPVVHPDRPSSSTTTSLPLSVAEEGNLVAGNEINTPKHVMVKRRFRFPSLIRPFISRRRNH